jgi:hypothetical protein
MALARLPGPSPTDAPVIVGRPVQADVASRHTRTPGLCAAIAKRDGTFPGADYAPNFATVDFSSKKLSRLKVYLVHRALCPNGRLSDETG